MIRFLIFILLAYAVYRLLLWLRDLRKKFSKASQFYFQKGGFARKSSREEKNVIDEMKACPQCGTYNPTRSALQKKELYFCNERCHEAYSNAHPKRESS